MDWPRNTTPTRAKRSGVSVANKVSVRGVGDRLRHALHAARACICVSHFLAGVALRQGVDERRVEVVHNAVNRALFRPDRQGRSRAELALPEDRPVWVSVAHLIPRKRHHVLLQALADSAVRRHRPYLVIRAN